MQMSKQGEITDGIMDGCFVNDVMTDMLVSVLTHPSQLPHIDSGLTYLELEKCHLVLCSPVKICTFIFYNCYSAILEIADFKFLHDKLTK